MPPREFKAQSLCRFEPRREGSCPFKQRCITTYVLKLSGGTRGEPDRRERLPTAMGCFISAGRDIR